MEENPVNSVRRLAQDHDFPSSLVHKVSKLEKCNPFKIHLVQELSDSDRRMEFCHILLNLCNDNPLQVDNCFFRMSFHIKW